MVRFRWRKRHTQPGGMTQRQAKRLCKATERIPPSNIIFFVETLEKADQYFGLKSHLLTLDENWFVPDDIAGEIQGDARFNKLDKEEIQHAIDAVNVELNVLEFHASSLVMKQGGLVPDDEEVITSNNSDLSEDVNEAAIFEKVAKLDMYVRSDPIFTLILQTHLKGRILHCEPEVELNMLKKIYPFYYYDFFIAKEQMYKAKTVTFTYDGCDISAKDIKSSLSNGEILFVSINRLDSQSHLAHVTFRDLKTATNALSLAAKGQLKMFGRPVGVIPTAYNEVPRRLPACKLEHVRAAMFAVEKVEDELLSDARRKYAVLVEKLNGSNVQGKAKKHKTEPELPDDVMSE